MQKWEYLEVYLDYSAGSWVDREGHRHYRAGSWADSMGREGQLVRVSPVWQHSGGLLNELGSQGWELVGVESYPEATGGGLAAAKWVFKRPVS